MIFTECKNGHPIICHYESSQEPIGVFEEIVCEECGAKTYVKRVSIGGISYNEEEFMKMNPFKLSKS